MVESASGEPASSSFRIDVDHECGLIEVSIGSVSDVIHVAFFLDRVTEARWGLPGDGENSGPATKSQALERLRTMPGWGDIPDDTSEEERRTLDRLAATPLWECAARLANFIAAEALQIDGWVPHRILELGAGLGVPSFVAARLWPEATVAITECGDSLMDLLRRNIQVNFPSVVPGAKKPKLSRGVFALSLAFGGEVAEVLHHLGGCPDLVIVSDCFFYPWYGDTWTPLRASLLQLCGATTLVLLGTRHRDGGKVEEAVDSILQPPFHRRLLLQRDIECYVCKGEGYIDFECCWRCEGNEWTKDREEVWLLATSAPLVASWKSATE